MNDEITLNELLDFGEKLKLNQKILNEMNEVLEWSKTLNEEQIQEAIEFLDEKIEEFHCEVDTDSKIISVKFRIKEAILQMNYRNKFIDVFGEPDASFCIGEIAKSSETKLSNGAVSSSAVIIPKKCDFFDNSVLATVWKLDNNVFLEFTHPQSRSTFPRAYINITKSSKWVEMK